MDLAIKNFKRSYKYFEFLNAQGRHFLGSFEISLGGHDPADPLATALYINIL